MHVSYLLFEFGWNHWHVEMLMELLRKEKIAEIDPDQELDIFIKVCLPGSSCS